MISQVIVQNYRSFDYTHVILGHLTVLVGPNASGKSNFVDALKFVSSGLGRGLEEVIADRHGYRNLSRWSAGRPRNLAVAVAVERLQMWSWFGFELSASSVVSQGFTVRWEMCDIHPSGDEPESPFVPFASPWLSKIKKIPLPVEQGRQAAKKNPDVGFTASENGWDRKPTGFPLPVGDWPEPPSDDLVLRTLGLLPPYKEVLDHLRGIRASTRCPRTNSVSLSLPPRAMHSRRPATTWRVYFERASRKARRPESCCVMPSRRVWMERLTSGCGMPAVA